MPAARVDLLLTYDWPYDEPFLALLSESLREAGSSVMLVSPRQRTEAWERMRSGNVEARAFLDRAVDTDPSFQILEDWAVEHVALHINPATRRREVWRKTNLHWDFIRAGLHTPYTLVVPSLRRSQAVEPRPDLSPLGMPFSIKPDLGGGGWGVVVDARDWDDVERARCRMPDDDLILQQFVEPAVLEGRRAWFRVLYVCGRVIPCWWDDRTHLFGEGVSAEERWRLHLNPLWQIIETAARIARLRFFSTEIARVDDGRFVVVDYVNDPVDVRIRPHAREGMPLDVARLVARSLAEFVAQAA